MSTTKQLRVLSTLAQEGHPATYTQEFVEHVEMLYRQSITLKDLLENKKKSSSMLTNKDNHSSHIIPLSEYPRVGDIVRCTDDDDIGLVISTSTIGPYGDNHKTSGMDLFVEVQWRDAGLCTDGWDARSFNTSNSLYEIVSRA